MVGGYHQSLESSSSSSSKTSGGSEDSADKYSKNLVTRRGKIGKADYLGSVYEELL